MTGPRAAAGRMPVFQRPRRHRRRLRARRRHARRRAGRRRRRSSWPGTSAASRRGCSTNCPVRRIDLDGDRPIVVTDARPDRRRPPDRDRRRLDAAALARACPSRCGRPASRSSTSARPTRPRSQLGRFPVFIYKGAGEHDDFYGMPDVPRPGREGRPGTAAPTSTPTSTTGPSATTTARSSAGSSAATSPPWPRRRSTSTEVCLYTVAPDEQFRLDFLPGRPDVIVASPCSGHGFKFSCLIGRILADLATRGETAIDITPWRFG